MSLTDGILALKRAINHRLKLLEELHQFSSIFPKNMGVLERLAAVGLARPFMIKQLFELRNDIEHNDHKPPLISRCHELVDITWYFLKATDAACLITQHHTLIRCDKGPFAKDPQLWIEVNRSNQSQLIIHGGWIDAALLSDIYMKGYLELQIDKLKVKQDFTQGDHDMRQESARWVSGSITLPPAEDQYYLKKVFALTF